MGVSDRVRGSHETTPLVIDGVMYLTAPQNHAYAIDVRTGRPLWHYERTLPKEMSLCCGPQNRGFAALGDRVFMGTLDAHVVALDAKTGRVRWDIAAADADKGYSFTGAPLVVKNKVIVGVAGGEYGVRGFIDAYDAETGKARVALLHDPGRGREGRRDMVRRFVEARRGADLGHRLLRSGAELLYWGTGNPGPQMYGANRLGDNLYSDSLVALDPDTGTLKWHFQFTPHDVHDWDSTHTPILFDDTIAGQPRKLVAVANRNGFFYVLDRVTGAYLLGRPYTQVTWAKEAGRQWTPDRAARTPIRRRRQPRLPEWHRRDELALAVLQSRGRISSTSSATSSATRSCRTSISSRRIVPDGRSSAAPSSRCRTNDRDAVRAVDPKTGTVQWVFKQYADAWAGVTSTAGGLVFSGDGQGNFIALDAETGKDLWHIPLGASIQTAAISFAVDGRQYVTIVAGDAVFAFALRREP